MTQIWDDENRAIAVTVVRVLPARVVQLRTPDRDGYSAVQVTYGTRKSRTLTKPEAGHFAKADVDPGKRLVELRVDDSSAYAVGQEITVGILNAGDRVDVTAVSKGKGFAGGMKRHNFKGQGGQPRQPQASPGAGLDRRLRHARPGLQGDTDGRPDRLAAGHHAQPRGHPGRCRAGPAAGARGGTGAPRRRRADPGRGQGRRSLMALTVPLRTVDGGSAGSVNLDEAVFGIQPNVAVMHQVVTAQLAAARAGTQSTKTRAEVSGGGREAVQAEGDGPGPAGFDPCAPLGRRRRGPRPEAPFVPAADTEEDGAAGAALGAVGSGFGRAGGGDRPSGRGRSRRRPTPRRPWSPSVSRARS